MVFVRFVKDLPGTKVLIGDNLSSHFSEKVLKLALENDILFVCLIANSTHLLQPLDVAFYGPLKRHWRKILDQWKTSCSKKAQTITKDKFPLLLKTLYTYIYSSDQEVSSNLVAGFKKCGIYPLNVSVVLNRLPDADKSIETVKSKVSQAVVNVLKRLRRVDGEEKEKPKRKKIITVDPGKSISLEDFQATFKNVPRTRTRTKRLL